MNVRFVVPLPEGRWLVTLDLIRADAMAQCHRSRVVAVPYDGALDYATAMAIGRTASDYRKGA